MGKPGDRARPVEQRFPQCRPVSGRRRQAHRPLPAQSRRKPPQRQVFEGLVKNGVVHLLEGELPDGIFVKVIRE